MSSERFQAVFFTTLVIFGFIIGWIGGLIGWLVAGAMILGVSTMFAYGCHKAAEEGYDQGADETAINLYRRWYARRAKHDEENVAAPHRSANQ